MRRAILFLTLIVVAAGVVGFQTGAYYYFQRLFTRTPSPANSSGNHNSSTSNTAYIEVNTIINYGNRTITWFNHTRVPENWNFYNVTILISNPGTVHSEYYSVYRENQVLGLNGVEQNSTDYWSLWKFCPRYNAWTLTPVGVDLVLLSNGGVYGWHYQSQSGTQLPPVPGAKSMLILDIGSC